MALRVWLPLNGNLENRGVSEINVVSGSPSYKAGKISSQSLNLNNRIIFDCPKLANLQTLSICFWGMAEESSTLTSNWQDLLGFTDVSSSGTNGTFRWETTYSSTNGIHWHDNATNAFVNGSHTHIAQKGVWCHCCVVFDYEKEKIFTYTNGILVNTHNHLGGKFNSTGRFYLGETNNIEGRINDVRIYDHALSAKEVKEISQGLVLHYKLDGFSGGAGRNLLRKPTTETGYGARNELTELTFSGWDKYADLDLVDIDWNNQVGKKLTYRCWLNNIEQTAGTGTGIMLHVRYADSTYQQYGGGKNGATGSYLAQGESGWVFITITIPDPTVRTNPTTITKIQASIRHNSSGGASTVEYKNSQVELSDIPTTFGFAPEDVGIDTTKIIDSSGYEWDGTVLGTVTTEMNESNGRYLISSKFNENADSVTIPSCFSVGQTQTEMTTSIWAKTNTLNSTTPNLMSLGENSFWRFRLVSASSVWWYIRVGSTQRSATYSISGKNLLDNNWHHYAVTFKNGIVVFYIDGVQIGTTNCSDSATYITCNNAGNTWHLAGYSTTSESFIGNLADARIYATALSAEDILDLYHTPANIDNLGGLHGFEFIEDTSARELLALPWTSAYSTHNKTSISINYNDKHEWYSNTNSSAGSDYIKINPTGNTYYYDTEISVAAGNQFYIGFERYDENKTSRSNNACVYIVSIKPTSDIIHQRYFGTVNLATDGVNPTDTIALRILNAWSGTTSGSTKEGTIHYLSLREVSGKPQTGKIKQQGQIYTDEFVEREKQASIYENGFVGGNMIIEK